MFGHRPFPAPLKPFAPPVDIVHEVDVDVRESGAGAFCLRYVLDAEISRLRIPETR